jgi:hypothetical protein
MFTGLLLALAINAFPTFDIENACRIDTEAAQEDNLAYQGCVKDEESARTTISAQWSRYPASSRMTCSSEQTDEFDGSYVELMTCLEMQDWKTHLGDIGGALAGGGSAAGSRAFGGSPLTPSQIGGFSATHPLGGVPGAHFR